MKRLLLLRHAKAVRSSAAGDFARELARRGQRDADRLGIFLSDEGLHPDALLASPAQRTRETAERVCAKLAEPPEIEWRRALYLAEPHTILEQIRDMDPAIETLLVVGHNPGIADLANLMAIAGDPDAREVMQSTFPTAALAVLELPGEVWQGASFHDARLLRFVTPKLLG